MQCVQNAIMRCGDVVAEDGMTKVISHLLSCCGKAPRGILTFFVISNCANNLWIIFKRMMKNGTGRTCYIWHAVSMSILTTSISTTSESLLRGLQ